MPAGCCIIKSLYKKRPAFSDEELKAGFSSFQACQPGDALRWAPFLPDEKWGKESPKAGPSPALWNPPRGTGCTCVLLASALGLVGSHRWCGTSTESTCFSGRQCFYRQGLTLVSRCSQRSAAGTPLLQVRPGHENRQAVGPATRVAWCGNSNRSHTKGNGPNLDLTQAQPRTPREVLRGERPKWLFVHFGQSKWTPAERFLFRTLRTLQFPVRRCTIPQLA